VTATTWDTSVAAAVRQRIPIQPPAPGRAVLACAGCGRILDADQLHFAPPRRGDSTLVRPVTCGPCAPCKHRRRWAVPR
jgi:hypothetical protein